MRLRDTSGTPGPTTGLAGWSLILLMAATQLIAFSDRFLIAVVATPMKQALSLSDAQVGLLQGTAFVVLYAAAMPGLGILVDRGYQRTVFLGSIAVWTAATFACGLAGSFAALVVCRIAVGLGQAGLAPAALSLIAQRSDRRNTGVAVSLLTAGGSLGRSAAFLGGGAILAWLVDRGGLWLPLFGAFAPWQALFVLACLPNVALAAMALRIAKVPPAGIRRGRAAFAIAWIHRRRAIYFPHFAASMAAVLMSQTLTAWAPTFYVRSHGMSPAESGISLGLLVLAATPLGHVLAGWLLDRLGARQKHTAAAWMLGVGLVLALPATAAMSFAAERTTSLCAFAGLVAILAFTSPAALAGIQFLTPVALRGRVSAVFIAAVTLTAIGTGPALLGLLSDTVFGARGLGAAFVTVFAVFGSLGAAAAYVAGRSGRRSGSGASARMKSTASATMAGR